MASGAGPGSPGRIVGASSDYDPATGQFLTRDPLSAVSREPYGYAMNDPVNNTDPTGLWCPLGKNPNGSCRGSGAVETAGDVAEGAVGLAGKAVKYTPTGQLFDAGSRLTGHSLGICAGGSIIGGYDLMGSVCYMVTPSGQSGFTVTAGGGGGAPMGLSGLVGLSVSNAQQSCDFDGTSVYLWGAAGEGPYGAGASGSLSDGGIWQTTVGWAPGFRVPAPFSFGGGVSRTWTIGW